MFFTVLNTENTVIVSRNVVPKISRTASGRCNPLKDNKPMQTLSGMIPEKNRVLFLIFFSNLFSATSPRRRMRSTMSPRNTKMSGEINR